MWNQYDNENDCHGLWMAIRWMKFLMGLLPDTQNCELRMRRECRECIPRHRFQRKPIVSDPGIHHDTCATHVPCCMSGSLTHSGGEKVPGIFGVCVARNFAYLARGPYSDAILHQREITGKPDHWLWVWHIDSTKENSILREFLEIVDIFVWRNI